MSAESTLYAALSLNAGIAAIVGDRVYPRLLPQGKPLPGIVFFRLDTEYITTIHGGAARGARIPMEIWGIAETSTVAEQLGDAIEAALGAANIMPTDRRPETDDESEAYSSVISCVIWT